VDSVDVAASPQQRRRPLLRRLLTPAVAVTIGALLLVTVVTLELVSSRDYIFLPDKAHPVAPLVKVAGGRNPAGSGGIYFVDVIVRKATLLEQIFGGLHSGADLYPANEVVPPGTSSAQAQQVDASEMRTSQEVAAAVALRALGKKVTTSENGALVSEVEPGFPAAHGLRPTDVIVSVDAKPVHSPDDVSRLMAGAKVGTPFRFTVARGGKRVVVPLKTVASAPGSKRGVVGVLLEPNESIKLPVKVSIDAHGVGGPSAGLAFALDVFQELGRNVDRGHKIAATGEIFLDGRVGPIGGIKQKTIGAREAGVDAFLVPAGQNAVDARKYAHGLRIIPVKSFQQALHALATLPEQR
jgi:PDZ domain-containing protein